MPKATNDAADATMPPVDATIPPAGQAADAAEASSAASSIPQVGDLIPRGVIVGVRLHSDGRCEISFDGAGWQPL
jgi:hypothetical protein